MRDIQLTLTEISLERDEYDLNYKRKILPMIEFRNRRDPLKTLEMQVPEDLQSERQDMINKGRQELNSSNKKLNGLSKELKFVYDHINCVCRAMHLATSLITKFTENTPQRPKASNPNREDKDNEAEDLARRIVEEKENLALCLDHLSVLIPRLQLSLLHSPSLTRSCKIPDFLLRFNHEGSNTVYDPRLGICSAAFKETICKIPSDLTPRRTTGLKKTFTAHVRGWEFEDDDNEKERLITPYISTSGNPHRMRNILRCYTGDAQRKGEICVISTKRLQESGTVFGRTTDIGDAFGVPKKDSWATDAHWLVEHWIPPNCIAATISVDKFYEACGTYSKKFAGEFLN